MHSSLLNPYLFDLQPITHHHLQQQNFGLMAHLCILLVPSRQNATFALLFLPHE